MLGNAGPNSFSHGIQPGGGTRGEGELLIHLPIHSCFVLVLWEIRCGTLRKVIIWILVSLISGFLFPGAAVGSSCGRMVLGDAREGGGAFAGVDWVITLMCGQNLMDYHERTMTVRAWAKTMCVILMAWFHIPAGVLLIYLFGENQWKISRKIKYLPFVSPDTSTYHYLHHMLVFNTCHHSEGE